jgi:Ca2+-binding EF-hand superfamily protein
MNANGDERIDHDEFVKFFLKMLMGSYEQKMLIAFKCYDVDNDQTISKEEVEVVLKNIPMNIEGRYGNSFAKDHSNLSRVDYLNQKSEDNEEISLLLGTLFNHQGGFGYTDDDGIYFDEFKKLAEEVTSELFVCIYNCIYQYIPCVKNFLVMKEKYN